MQKKEQHASTVWFFLFFLDETGGWNIYMNLLQNKGQRLFDIDLKKSELLKLPSGDPGHALGSSQGWNTSTNSKLDQSTKSLQNPVFIISM